MVLCVWGGFMMSIKGGVRRRHPAWMKETHMYAHIDDSSLVLIFHCLQTCFFPSRSAKSKTRLSDKLFVCYCSRFCIV